MVYNLTISDPEEFFFFPEDKSSLRSFFRRKKYFLNFLENREFLKKIGIPKTGFLKSEKDFQQVENKYLEISKVWSYTEKILTKIIYAREAEQSIKDFYFDQVVELRLVFLSCSLIGRNQSTNERQGKPIKGGHSTQIRLRLGEIFMSLIS